MSNLLNSDVQEDVRTFPMYQRLRKTNPYAYYSLNTQINNYGSVDEQNLLQYIRL